MIKFEKGKMPKPCTKCGCRIFDSNGDMLCGAYEEKEECPDLYYGVASPGDPVNHPSHYTDGKIEVIDFIEDKKLPFHLGNAVKYISRAGKKDPSKTVEDLEKAVWYLNRYIDLLEKEEKK